MQKLVLNTYLFKAGTPKSEANAKKNVCGVIQFTFLRCEIKSQLQHLWMLPYQNYSPDTKNYGGKLKNLSIY